MLIFKKINSCIYNTSHKNPVLICVPAAFTFTQPKQPVFKDRWSMPGSASMTTLLIIKFTELVIKKVLNRLLLASRYKSSLTISPLFMVRLNAEHARTSATEFSNVKIAKAYCNSWIARSIQEVVAHFLKQCDFCHISKWNECKRIHRGHLGLLRRCPSS